MGGWRDVRLVLFLRNILGCGPSVSTVLPFFALVRVAEGSLHLAAGPLPGHDHERDAGQGEYGRDPDVASRLQELAFRLVRSGVLVYGCAGLPALVLW